MHTFFQLIIFFIKQTFQVALGLLTKSRSSIIRVHLPFIENQVWKTATEKALNQHDKPGKLKSEIHICSTVFGLIFWGTSFVPMQFIHGQNEGLQLEGGAQMHQQRYSMKFWIIPLRRAQIKLLKNTTENNEDIFKISQSST